MFLSMPDLNKTIAVILAAGKSTRMQAKKPKLLFKIRGKPVVCHVTDACRKAGIEDIALIVGLNADEIKKATGNKYMYAFQNPPLGTGHALLSARDQLLKDYQGDVVVLPGDAPFITPAIIRKLVQYHCQAGAAVTLLTTIFDNPPPYGRVIRNRAGGVLKIVEENDATPAQKAIRELNTSHYCFDARQILPLLDKIRNHNAKKEYYLTDIVEIAARLKKKIVALPVKDPFLLLGINTRMDLQRARSAFMENTNRTNMKQEKVTVSAPGRICLFGEHQDYLGLPVIAMAIDRYIKITGQPRQDKVFHIDLPDIGDEENIDYSREIKYVGERDYFRSAVNILKRQGIKFPHGYDCVLAGTIPIRSGTSSSSALCVAWTKFLLTIANDPRQEDSVEIARLAHQAEVLEFKEPGGMMDHFSSAVGTLLYIEFNEDILKNKEPRIVKLPAKLGTFVLGDSCQEKDTKAILSRVKGGILEAKQIIAKKKKNYSLATAELSDAKYLPEHLKKLFEGVILDRDITRIALKKLSQPKIDHEQIGDLLFQLHGILRDNLKISTPKIDRMLQAALDAGGLGGKINGSGGGGCMFAYAPEKTDAVAKAIAKAGGKPYVIRMSNGASILKGE